MLRRCVAAMYSGSLKNSETEDVLCASRECHFVDLRIWDVLVGEYPAVDELFHLINVDLKASEGVYSGIFPVAYDAQVEVVRGDAVAACPHRFFA